MSNPPFVEAPKEIQDAINKKFTAAAFAAVPRATTCNRFAVLPGQPNPVLVLGAVYAVQLEEGEGVVEANAAAAFYIAKSTAEDIIVNLLAFLEISEADLETARVRNASIIGKVK